jgi:hypothetical protein
LLRRSGKSKNSELWQKSKEGEKSKANGNRIKLTVLCFLNIKKKVGGKWP